MELSLTIAFLVAELAVMGFCYVQQKKPVNPAKPRLAPYGIIMLVMGAIAFTTTAHVIGLVTGHPVVPRTGLKGTTGQQ